LGLPAAVAAFQAAATGSRFGSRIPRFELNRKKYRIESNPNLSCRINPKICRIIPKKTLKSRFKSQSRFGFAHHCIYSV